MLAELGTSGSLDAASRVTFKGRFQPKHIESIVRQYLKEYVLCKLCKSPDTKLTRVSVLGSCILLTVVFCVRIAILVFILWGATLAVPVVQWLQSNLVTKPRLGSVRRNKKVDTVFYVRVTYHSGITLCTSFITLMISVTRK